jgi:hypothetical protein
MSWTVDKTVFVGDSDGAFGGVALDVESGDDADDALVSDPVSATATPGVPAMPNPTPNATARVPTRPTYRA